MRFFSVVFALGFLLTILSCGGGGSSTNSSAGPSTPTSPTTPGAPPPATATPDVRAAYLVSQLTQAEKLQLVHGASQIQWWLQTNIPHGAGGWVPGISRLGIPDLCFGDGSTGLANNIGQGTALPSSIASAAAWDLDLAYKYGQVVGSELSAYGVNLNTGGNVNLTGREPRDGRTFETKGEDPLLAGSITAAHVKAIQDQYVLAGLKHFAFNDQETGRQTANVLIDERSARETDLLAFEIALKESNVQSVMCSYNLVNGSYACENAALLNSFLKGDLAFPGFVFSDWAATHSTVNAVLNGQDQEMPTYAYFGSALQTAMQNGQVPQSRLDDMVQRILRAMYADGLFDHPQTIHGIDATTDAAIAQQVEEQGAVLLKNTGILPLDATKIHSIAIIGSHADIGVLSGGGSAQVMPVGGAALNEGKPAVPGWSQVIWDPSPPLSAIQALAPNASVQFNDGTNAATAAALAASSDAAIVFVSQWASEGMDIPSLNFTDVIHSTPIDQDALVDAVTAVNPKTVVVMENGGPQVMPWLANVAAVLEAWYPGQNGGPAIANILVGVVNPSGKLPITFPASVNDLPRPSIAQPPDSTTPFAVDYTIDGYNTGYKWYASKGITPLFPFGFGLSYTTFSLTNPQLVATTTGTPSFQVTARLQNTGSRTGAEVVQVYLQLPASTNEANRLVAWQKLSLSPGQQQTVAIQVSGSDVSHPFSYWDVPGHAWITASGAYTVFVGNSFGNLQNAGSFNLP